MFGSGPCFIAHGTDHAAPDDDLRGLIDAWPTLPEPVRAMIRNFAGDDRKLIELVKPEMRIGTHRRSPSGILFRDDFYRDAVCDFDAELLTPVEQKFAKVYLKVLKATKLDGHEGAAFIDWVAAMLVRTDLVTELMPHVPEGLSDPAAADNFDRLKRLLDNVARSQWFEMYQDLFARAGWRWKFRRFVREAGDLILTDHPVCTTNIQREGGQLVFVPLALDTMLFGGSADALEQMRNKTVAHVNFVLAAWPQRHIFAGKKEPLEQVKMLLSDESPFSREQVEIARQPLFGAPARVRERMQTDPMPKGFDFGAALRRHIESFGPYRWETEDRDEGDQMSRGDS